MPARDTDSTHLWATAWLRNVFCLAGRCCFFRTELDILVEYSKIVYMVGWAGSPDREPYGRTQIKSSRHLNHLYRRHLFELRYRYFGIHSFATPLPPVIYIFLSGHIYIYNNQIHSKVNDLNDDKDWKWECIGNDRKKCII